MSMTNCVQSALILMHLAGWVHRDISAGNIIAVVRDGELGGKLSDFEYATSCDDESGSSDPTMVCCRGI
jgi:hypothetical protein